eukprot:11558478-Ditylum_brightwellii.AAC.1
MPSSHPKTKKKKASQSQHHQSKNNQSSPSSPLKYAQEICVDCDARKKRESRFMIESTDESIEKAVTDCFVFRVPAQKQVVGKVFGRSHKNIKLIQMILESDFSIKYNVEAGAFEGFASSPGLCFEIEVRIQSLVNMSIKDNIIAQNRTVIHEMEKLSIDKLISTPK